MKASLPARIGGYLIAGSAVLASAGFIQNAFRVASVSPAAAKVSYGMAGASIVASVIMARKTDSTFDLDR